MSSVGVELRPRVHVAAAVLQAADGRVLVAQRPAGVHLEGLWEFPGGKLEPGEAPAAAALRELEEETGLGGGVLEALTVIEHDYAEVAIRLHVFLVRHPTGRIRMDARRRHAWVDIDELSRLEMPEANRQIVDALRLRLGVS